MKVIKARVKYKPKEKDGNYGPYISVGLVPIGESFDDKSKVVNVYGKPDEEYIKSLAWKQEVTIAEIDGKWKLVEPDQKPTAQNGTAKQSEQRPGVTLSTMNKEEKLAMDAELQAYAKLHARCWVLASESFPEGVLPDNETIQKVATTLFIQITRRYAL